VDSAGIGEDCALGEEPFEAARVPGAEASQIIVAELVDDDGDNQLWFLSVSRRQAGRGENRNGQDLSDALWSVSRTSVGIATAPAGASRAPSVYMEWTRPRASECTSLGQISPD
jgi:hypothetical protein